MRLELQSESVVPEVMSSVHAAGSVVNKTMSALQVLQSNDR